MTMKLEKSEITRTMFSEDKKVKTVITTEIDTSGQKTVTKATYINGNESSYKKESKESVEERHTYIQTLDESGKPDQYQTTINRKTSVDDGYSVTVKRYKTGKFSDAGRRNWTMGEAVNITSTYELTHDLCGHDCDGNSVNARESSRREYYNGDKLVRTITEEDSAGDTLIIEDYEYPVCGCVFKTTHSTDYGSPKCNSSNVLSINVDKLCAPSIAGIARFIEAKGGIATIDVLNLKGTIKYQTMTLDANYIFDFSEKETVYNLSVTVVDGDHRDSKLTMYSYGGDFGNFCCERTTHSEKPDEGHIADTYIWAVRGYTGITAPSLEYIMSSLTTIKGLMLDILPKNFGTLLYTENASGAAACRRATTLYFPNAEVTTTKHYIAVDDDEKENKTETPTTEPAPAPTAERKPKAPYILTSVKRTTLKKELYKKGGKVTVYEPNYVSEYELNMVSSTRRERS